MVAYTADLFAKALPDVSIELGELGFNFLWYTWQMTSPAVEIAPKSIRDQNEQDAKSDLTAARAAVWDLIHVDSNMKGGGGTEAYRKQLQKLRKSLDIVPARIRDNCNCHSAVDTLLWPSWTLWITFVFVYTQLAYTRSKKK